VANEEEGEGAPGEDAPEEPETPPGEPAAEPDPTPPDGVPLEPIDDADTIPDPVEPEVTETVGSSIERAIEHEALRKSTETPEPEG